MLSNTIRAAMIWLLASTPAFMVTPARADSSFPVASAFTDELAAPSAASRAPRWCQTRSGMNPLDNSGVDLGKAMYVVVQKDGPGGSDAVTVRYPIDGRGTLRTFIGAGVGQAEYYEAQGAERAAIPLSLRETHRSIGAVAEVGSEWRASERLRIDASFRWSDVAAESHIARDDNGPVAAERLTLTLGVGYRFH